MKSIVAKSIRLYEGDNRTPSFQDRANSLLRLEDKDLLQIDATVIVGVLVLSTVGALKLNIAAIAWVASTVIWFSFSAFLILVSYIFKSDASTDDRKTKT
jgi:hypothetical protein